MKTKALFKPLILCTFLICLCSCQKNKTCYDEALYQAHKNDICKMDCPGVIGCDGKTYCNACIANSQGIRVK
ncbi:MAG: hypothetical protein JNK73_06440 [Bacteroidia bacterium]|nr:hypothetical protein [Bacteroidia bacterium]